jgi:hypothetical protein
MLKRSLPDDASDQELLLEDDEHLLNNMSAAEIGCLK